MSIYEWLSRWEQIEAPGKHSRMIPADGAVGYPRIQTSTNWDFVNKAIPVKGRVDAKPSWVNSPQVRFWLEKPRKTLLERFADWLKK